MWLIIVGSPTQGFYYYGPFDDYDAAEKYAEKSFRLSRWWIALLNKC